MKFHSSGLLQPRTIIFLTHSAAWSGAEIALFHLVTHLDKKRWKPIVVVFEDGLLIEKLREAGIKTRLLPLNPAVSELRKEAVGVKNVLQWRQIGIMWRFCHALTRLIQRERAAIVHCNSLKADFLGGIAGKWARVSTIWHVRDRIAPDYLPRPVVFAFPLAMRILGVRAITVSNAVRQTLRLPLALKEQIRVVHDGLPDPDIGVETNTANALMIGMIGRLSPWKGQHVFLEAIAIVREHFPDVRFQIVGAALFGEEEYEREIKAQAESLGLADALQWMGFRADAPQLLHQMNIVVHASTTGEPFGQVIVEAMLAGKPVVATDGGGVPEIVREGQTGLLVPMNDFQALAAAIMWLLQNPAAAQRMGEAGRARALSCFSIQKTAREIEEIYSQLLAR
ncbi:Glycosyltransferase involved in cell wall bisynthesis [Abditibacterium utsteinense]|uniref:Glycosyltransferase involved in cell wall bisynthesis n=1 Tax=Abditibacterium utsteinense TaxID=1960156 RepID=A0A2S8SSF0_9BACT|nr:glycosyltransferase family 4 protein [Abditibacterium utsteinense]PQV63706.1 Glycosyltransferase involved in cell wall bisynthesis [Abditibacterium utsteinense]